MKVRGLIKRLNDLQNIRNYIAENNPQTADRFVIDLYDSVTKQLGQFPRLGRIIPERGDPDFREIIRGSYRVMYRVKRNFVEVQSVIHSKRLSRCYEDSSSIQTFHTLSSTRILLVITIAFRIEKTNAV